MGLDARDIARLGQGAQRQIVEKLGAAEKASAPQTPKANKYHNQHDERGEIKFHSKKEARRYDELMLLLKAGKIRNLKLQPQFTLQESYVTPEGKRVGAIRYVADFEYEEFQYEHNGVKYWKRIVEDVKSRATRTPQYMMKRKMMRKNFGIEIEEV